MGTLVKETLTFLDDDIARFMDEAAARRGRVAAADRRTSPGRYETAFRVIGRYMDEQKPQRRLLLRAGRRVRRPAPDDRPGRQPPRSSPSSPARTSPGWSPRARASAHPENADRVEPPDGQSS